jgi:hypothetical protein
MNDIFRKTLGGLTREYYFRQFFFGVILSVAFFYMRTQGDFSKLEIRDILIIIVNTFLYPYSRFIYESIMDFFLGNNVFWTSGIVLYFMMVFKIMMMFLCWAAATLIAPVGLLYLYYVNRNI